ncbi:MAG: hypothetical protein HEEMFOPI_01512 [Holosporales bacterium]
MNKNEEIGKRIRIVRRMLNQTREDLAQKYNIEYKTFSLWETGKVTITDKIIHQCLQIFLKEGVDCSFDWIKIGIGEHPKIIDKEKQSQEYFLNRPDISPEIKFFLDVENYKKVNENSVIYQAKNKSMAPLIDVGDIVGGEPLTKECFYIANGKMCIISIDEKKLMIRNVFKKNNTFTFIAQNHLAASVNPIITTEPPKLIAPVNFYRKAPLNLNKNYQNENF